MPELTPTTIAFGQMAFGLALLPLAISCRILQALLRPRRRWPRELRHLPEPQWLRQPLQQRRLQRLRTEAHEERPVVMGRNGKGPWQMEVRR